MSHPLHPRSIDLAKLNSATKYPSIDTYHDIGDRGRLTEKLRTPVPPDVQLFATEKVDGANCRIVAFFGDDRPTYLIGSREDWFTARGDLIANPDQGIVEAALPWAETIMKAEFQKLVRIHDGGPYVIVFAGEAYGGSLLPEAKRYTATKASGFRLFDAMLFSVDELRETLSYSVEQLAGWRGRGGQKFLNLEALDRLAATHDVPLVPRFQVSAPPTNVKDTYDWLQKVLPGPTQVAIDGQPGRPEGVVLRNADRSFICKIRFEDYERTLRPPQLPKRQRREEVES